MNHNTEFPRPIHVLSDGSVLDQLAIAALRDSVGASHSIEKPPTQDHGARSSPRDWARRHIELDGVGGLARAVKSRVRPSARIAMSSLPGRANSHDTTTVDESFISRYNGGSPPLVATPESISEAQTVVLLGAAPHTCDADQIVRLHIGWPSLPGRGGVLSALTHRNLEALRVVVEASGPVAGWATAAPPIARDDDVDSMHRRLCALGAELLASVVSDPAATLTPIAPPRMRFTIVDEQAVRSDIKSGRFGELVRAITRF